MENKPENLKTPLDFEIRGRYDYCNGGTIDRFVEATAKTKGKEFLDRYYLGWLLRLIFNPLIFFKRYIFGLKLIPMVIFSRIKILD